MAVAQLQKKLEANGFGPGAIDGDFGPATEAALLNFQKSRGLLADGIAGPRTLEKLQRPAAWSMADIMGLMFSPRPTVKAVSS